MHEAKTRLSELVAAAERGEIVVIQRHGKPVAEIRHYQPETSQKFDRLKTDPRLRVAFAPGYDPIEPASEDDWPKEYR